MTASKQVGEVVTKEKMAQEYEDDQANRLECYKDVDSPGESWLRGFEASTALHEAEKRKVAHQAWFAGRWREAYDRDLEESGEGRGIEPPKSFDDFWQSRSTAKVTGGGEK